MKHQIKQAVLRAFSSLKTVDGALFDCEIEEEFGYDARKLHEVCINHKLAIYLENEIIPIIDDTTQTYFADIEFNREGLNKKKIVDGNGEEIVVRPDIIIHNRKSGEQKKNFLIVECKKNGVQSKAIDTDRKKIRAFMENDKYMYSFGLQVVYGKDEIRGTLFCKNGKAIEPEEIICTG